MDVFVLMGERQSCEDEDDQIPFSHQHKHIHLVILVFTALPFSHQQS